MQGVRVDNLFATLIQRSDFTTAACGPALTMAQVTALLVMPLTASDALQGHRHTDCATAVSLLKDGCGQRNPPSAGPDTFARPGARAMSVTL